MFEQEPDPTYQFGHGLRMIQTSLTNLILYNVCGLLALLALLWIGRIVRTWFREQRRRRHRVVCGICGQLFQNDTRDEAVQCPTCHRLVPRQKVLDL
jgi:DNA-directed RNA polymerase subunit RPC12/RpoP